MVTKFVDWYGQEHAVVPKKTEVFERGMLFNPYEIIKHYFEGNLMKLKNKIITILFMLALLLSSMVSFEIHAETPPPVAEDLSNVVWLHTDVSSWPQTATLKSVTITSSLVYLDYDKVNIWPAADGVNANPWIFVYRNNTWYAATWEWMRFGSIVKGLYAVNGDHIKKEPLLDFTPVPGELYGFMVSGLARDSKRTVLERSNIVWFNWAVPSVNWAAVTPVPAANQPSMQSINNLLLLEKERN